MALHITLPPNTPVWISVALGVGIGLAAVILALTRLAKSILPSADGRQRWWETYLRYRADLRRERWARQDRLRMTRQQRDAAASRAQHPEPASDPDPPSAE